MASQKSKEIALKLEGLGKKYGDFEAVKDIDLEVYDGEVFGLLGPNGAGKTTTISMIVTMRRPTSGTASVYGHDIIHEKDDVRECLGIVFQDQTLDKELTARENLDIHAMLYGIPKKEREARIKELVKIVKLEDKLDERVKKFSGGMKRRLEIARSLIHQPKIIFLDEPTTGLDTQTRAAIWGYIKTLNQEKGITIILTTHYMDEADAACSRLAIIDHGKIVAMGSPKELKDELGGDIITIETADSEELRTALKKMKWAKSIKVHDKEIAIKAEKGEKRLVEIVKLAEKIGTSIVSLNLRKPTLDDVFIHYTGGSIRQQAADSRDNMKHMPMRR